MRTRRWIRQRTSLTGKLTFRRSCKQLSSDKGNKSGRITLAAAGIALAGTLGAPIVTEVTKHPQVPPMNETCLQLQLEYIRAIEDSSTQRELILPGKDGLSTLAEDPQAKYCHLHVDDFVAPPSSVRPKDSNRHKTR